MANGDTINQVKELLAHPQGMSNRSAQIMTLTLLAELYEKWETTNKKVDEIYPFVTQQRDEKKTQRDSEIHYRRLAVGVAITSALLWLFHVISTYFGARGSP